MDMGMLAVDSPAELQASMPEEWAAWVSDSFHNRVPGGESGLDLARRLGPLIIEIERLRRPALIVSHARTLGMLMAYFTRCDVRSVAVSDAPVVPRGVLVELRPTLYGWTETRFDLGESRDIEALALQPLPPPSGPCYHS
eukprot:c17443_g1_i1.p5 GENE.c17443_g1_i1~~c17443_g1_i1.p5  ORF type:complete len:140 (+),score=22.26 c17443_g1_i1:822-1241(+)